MKKLLISAILFTFTLPLLANNIQVSTPTISGGDTDNDYATVQFDLSWENSFRDNINWDAAWVFVKYQITGGDWQHASLNTTAGNHNIPGGYTCSVGETGGVGMGVFIYRSANGSGNNNLSDVELRWEYGTDGVADNASFTVKVFAVEMVYVPTGAFAAGSGGSEHNCFTLTTINTADATTAPTGTGGFSGSAMGGYPTGQPAPANATWPNGYSAFYCMKYEISHGQWVDYLNTLTRPQQNTRTETDVSTDAITNIFVMSNSATESYRNRITCPAAGNGTTNPITFSTDRYDRACNYLSYMDQAAFADWSGLRPMTELEHEKACRGTLAPVANEFPWGNTSMTAATTISGAEDGTETITNPGANCHARVQPFTGGDGGAGPLRCGIFATGASSRAEAGATYYGIMDMGFSLWNRCVYIGNASGQTFTGTHGDGTLTANGWATNIDWPGYNSIEVAGAWGTCGRSGDYYNGYFGQISNRGGTTSGLSGRLRHTGFRCVRTEP